MVAIAYPSRSWSNDIYNIAKFWNGLKVKAELRITMKGHKHSVDVNTITTALKPISDWLIIHCLGKLNTSFLYSIEPDKFERTL